MPASRSTSALVVKRIVPAIVWRWMKVELSGGFEQRLARSLRRFDVIAEKIVVLDLELLHPRVLGVGGLQFGDDAAAFVTQP